MPAALFLVFLAATVPFPFASPLPMVPVMGKTVEKVDITGVLDTGVECPLLRGDDGQVHALSGDLDGFAAGTRVRITGQPVEISFCMQGDGTIAIETIAPAE